MPFCNGAMLGGRVRSWRPIGEFTAATAEPQTTKWQFSWYSANMAAPQSTRITGMMRSADFEMQCELNSGRDLCHSTWQHRSCLPGITCAGSVVETAGAAAGAAEGAAAGALDGMVRTRPPCWDRLLCTQCGTISVGRTVSQNMIVIGACKTRWIRSGLFTNGNKNEPSNCLGRLCYHLAYMVASEMEQRRRHDRAHHACLSCIGGLADEQGWSEGRGQERECGCEGCSRAGLHVCGERHFVRYYGDVVLVAVPALRMKTTLK